ncbi:hypothetical protein LCI18_003770 [Fusarium solani-melongenae]|uniref:Uncharacterized protein n=1 Tax=Fusarium solani subsp. cucurbitae TaxID=2747967 RepID=A0ACD3YV50_FUSSC|nr:hypothetical protein LCI18_003770 [Fusarium solani-melongenae]
MAVCKQSGESRLFAELDESGLSSGEPPEELDSGTFFEEKERSLPLTDGQVGKICKSQPSSIVLRYATLDINKATSKPSLPTTMDVIQLQEEWEARILKSFNDRGYAITSRYCLKASPYLTVWYGLETLTRMYRPVNLDSSQDAFYIREELVQAGLTPELCSRQITLKPQALKETESARRKRRLSDAFPINDSADRDKRIRLNAQRAHVELFRTKTAGDATRSLTYAIYANSSSVNSTASFPDGMIDILLSSTASTPPVLRFSTFVYRRIGEWLGLDPSVLLTICGVLWAIHKLYAQLLNMIGNIINKHWTCIVTIPKADPIFDHMMHFLARKLTTKSRHLAVKTVWKIVPEKGENDDVAKYPAVTIASDGDDPLKLHNFADQAARSVSEHLFLHFFENYYNSKGLQKPRYIPSIGTTIFYHNGVRFTFLRQKEAVTTGGISNINTEELKISCLGRSNEPIKRLLADAKLAYYKETEHKTTIFRPQMKADHPDGSRMWQVVSRRPIRPMETVILEKAEKHKVLKDMNDYLDPAAYQWYANRGIPLRRGYLFHGPPGTGKSSFSFALAGIFGVDIHVISLQDPTLNEESLVFLLTELPRRCIVLLEDIDTAGLRRPDDAELESEDGIMGVTKEGIHRGRKRSSPITTHDILPQGISLSALLNAIDGVASHEGRILIVTTNKPEALDEALVRPGRVDVQVAFKRASRRQATELFGRMYDGVQLKLEEVEVAEGETEHIVAVDKAEELSSLSEEFGKLIPEEVFSPAEIQGFLLKRKDDPRKALAEVADWIKASVQQKESKSRVTTAQ